MKRLIAGVQPLGADKWPPRTFFVIGREAEMFVDMVKFKTWHENLGTAQSNRPTKAKCCGIYKITVECEGYYIDNKWHAENTPPRSEPEKKE